MPTSNLPNGTQGLGWFLRRTKDPIAAAPFYIEGLGLPKLRSWNLPEDAGVMLWAGETATLELNCISREVDFKPEDATCLPIFRSADLARSQERALTHGAKLVSEGENDRARLLRFTDPEGFGFGIEQVKHPRYQTDAFHDQLHQSAQTTLPGEIAIDGPIEGISRVLHFAQDVASEVAFLEQMGFPKVHDHGISLGGGCLVEVVQSDADREPIAERTLSFDTWIARVYGLEDFTDALANANGTHISKHVFTGGTLEYALTPGNVLFGWQERNPYDADKQFTQMVEDLHARSLWVKRHK